MFNQVNRRLTAALMALAVVISNVIAPVAPAFASSNDKQVYCNIEGNSGQWKAQISNGNTEHEFKLPGVFVHDQHDVTPAMNDQCTKLFQAPTPTAPVATPATCDTAGSLTLSDALDYTWSTNPAYHGPGTYTATATIRNNVNKVFSNGKTSISFNNVIVQQQLDGPQCHKPADKITYTEWVDGQEDCTTLTVTQTRNKITTPYKWDQNSNSWVLDTAHAVITQDTPRQRNLTSSELMACTPKPKDTTTYSEWSDTAPYKCGNTFIDQTRTKTSTTYTWSGAAWMSTVTTTTESRTRVPTANELAICAKPANYTTTTTKTATICLPGGGGKTTTWTTVNTYTHILISNKWVSILKSSKTTDQTVDASEADCPTPKQVNPTCNTLGSLTLPAYKDGIPGVHHTYYVWVNGIRTSYSASSDVVVANIPQGATVEVRLYINGTERFGWPIYKHTFTFSTSDCIAIPQPPQQADECGPNNAYWIIPADTNDVHWSTNTTNGHLIATAIGGHFVGGAATIDFGAAKDSNDVCPPAVVTPVKPQIVDCEVVLPITLGITYKEVYLDTNGNIVDPSQAGITATHRGVLATANPGYVLSTTNYDEQGYLYTFDFTDMNCGKGDVTPPTVTPPVVTTAPTTPPTPAELPHTGSSLGGLLVTLLATLSTYGVVYFLQPKRR